MMRGAVVVALLSLLSQLSQQRAAFLGGYGCAAVSQQPSRAYRKTTERPPRGVWEADTALLSIRRAGWDA